MTGRARFIATTTTLSGSATATWVIHLLIRPPCPDGYVRLLDLSPFVPILTGIVLVASGTTLCRERRQPLELSWADVLIGAFVTCLAAAALGVGLYALSTDNAAFSGNCWTF